MAENRDDSAFRNRLQKNARHVGRWATRQQLEGWRVYQRDIPEFPYVIDRYADRLHVQLLEGKRQLSDAEIADDLSHIGVALNVEARAIVLKLRRRQRGQSQYEKLDESAPFFVLNERDLCFEVNLGRYLDTGLFLDHRLLRQRVRQEARGKRVLNLFAYTGSFTVYAAAGGAARTVTVDLSKTYLDWARRNLALNKLDDFERHQLIHADVLAWIGQAQRAPDRFDLIIVDPPSFSNSKRMTASFDVQRDHRKLLEQTLTLLAPGGCVYFSNNRQGFSLDPQLGSQVSVTELTHLTVPDDFKRYRPHQCWQLRLSS